MFKQIYAEFGAYKGLNGTVATVGGCFEYTGAPYYSALSALKAGCDLSHIFCTQSAGIPLKAYSPEVIVHPSLKASNESPSLLNDEDRLSCIDSVTRWLHAMHVLVVGPGLGRDGFLVNQTVPSIIEAARDAGKFLVMDADGLNLLMNHPVTQGYSRTVLTPNAVEFKRLWRTYIGGEVDIPVVDTQQNLEEVSSDCESVAAVVKLAQTLGNFVLLKGKVDIITDGTRVVCVGSPGSQKRVGGQGDVLSGSLATILHLGSLRGVSPIDCAAAASLLVRKSALDAFTQAGWSLTAPDIIAALPGALRYYINTSA